MSENFWKSFPTPFKTFTKVFIKINGEVRALFVYEEPHGISDRLILSLAPAAGLVPPPKPALTIVWRWIRTRLNVSSINVSS